MTADKNYIYKLFNLKNKIVILTGGLGKLGTEYCEALVKTGAKVAIFDLIVTPNDKLKKLAKKYPILFLKVDVTKEVEVENGIKTIEKKWGVPTILINNAGWKASPNQTTKASVPFQDYPIEVWEEVFKINTTSAAICSKIVGSEMIKNKKGGVILNIASHYALVSPDQRIYAYKQIKEGKKFIKDASYGASKAALIALTRDLATHWAPYGIRVNSFSPGAVDNPASDPDFVKEYNFRTPLGRRAKEGEYNGVILFLVSSASSYMTGSNLVVDGGWTAW